MTDLSLVKASASERHCSEVTVLYGTASSLFARDNSFVLLCERMTQALLRSIFATRHHPRPTNKPDSPRGAAVRLIYAVVAYAAPLRICTNSSL